MRDASLYAQRCALSRLRFDSKLSPCVSGPCPLLTLIERAQHADAPTAAAAALLIATPHPPFVRRPCMPHGRAIRICQRRVLRPMPPRPPPSRLWAPRAAAERACGRAGLKVPMRPPSPNSGRRVRQGRAGRVASAGRTEGGAGGKAPQRPGRPGPLLLLLPPPPSALSSVVPAAVAADGGADCAALAVAAGGAGSRCGASRAAGNRGPFAHSQDFQLTVRSRAVCFHQRLVGETWCKLICESGASSSAACIGFGGAARLDRRAA